MVQEKSTNEKVVTWVHLWGTFGGLLIVIITSWVNMSVKVGALGKAQEDSDKSTEKILQSINELRNIQMQEIKEIGELKGQLQAYQTITAQH